MPKVAIPAICWRPNGNQIELGEAQLPMTLSDRPSRRHVFASLGSLLAGVGLVNPGRAAAGGGSQQGDLVYESRQLAAASRIPTASGSIVTLAYAHAGDGGGARYVRGNAADSAFTSRDGASWALDPTQPAINAQMFGAVGDGAWNSDDGSISGTDDRHALQSMIDWALRNRVTDVQLIKSHRIGGPLHLGWGDNFRTIRIHGPTRSSYYTLPGARLLCDFHNAMAINVQGGRRSGVHGLTLIGRNFVHTESRQVAAETLSEDPRDWLDQHIAPQGNAPGGIQVHAPYAGITIDAYSGAKPADSYPAVAYPAHTGLGPAQYDKALSSDTTIEDCTIIGFGVAICQSPNSPLQGDFLRVRNCHIANCAYGISVGNHQSRNVEVRNILFRGLHTCVTNARNGAQVGVFGGPIENCSLGHCFQFCDFTNAGALMPVTIRDLYFETTVRVGVTSNGVAAHYPVVFEGGLWSLSQSLLGRYPKALIEAGTQAIVLRNVGIAADRRIPVLASPDTSVTIDGGHWGGRLGDLTGSAALQRAVNFTGGVFVPQARIGAGTQARFASPLQGAFRQTEKSTSGSRLLSERVSFETSSGRTVRAPIAQMHREFTDANGRQWRLHGPVSGEIDFASRAQVPVPPRWSQDTMRFTYRAARQADSRTMLQAGSLIYAPASGTLFVVLDAAAPGGGDAGDCIITCRQLNNLKLDVASGEVAENPCASQGTVGLAFISHTAIELPRSLRFGAFGKGSTRVGLDGSSETENVGSADGLAAGDRLHGLAPPSGDAWPIRAEGSAVVSAPGAATGAGGTLSLADPAVATGTFPLYPVPIS